MDFNLEIPFDGAVYVLLHLASTSSVHGVFFDLLTSFEIVMIIFEELLFVL